MSNDKMLKILHETFNKKFEGCATGPNSFVCKIDDKLYEFIKPITLEQFAIEVERIKKELATYDN